MVFVFWGVIALMTVVAVVPLFIVKLSQRVLPFLVKVMIVLLIPILALVLYWHLGNSNDLFQYWRLTRQAQVVKQELTHIKSPQQVVHQLQAYLAAHPNSPQGWYLLGKLYYAQQDFKRAVPALQKAYVQAPQHLTYAVSLAEADFFYRHRRLSSAMKNLMLNVIKKDKNNVGALNLLAIDNYLRGHYRFAIQYWERLLPVFPAGSKDQQFLLSMIAKAQTKEEK